MRSAVNYTFAIGSIKGNQLQVSLPGAGMYSLEVYSMLGYKLADFSNRRGCTGFNTVPLNLSQGAYITRLKSNGKQIERSIRIFR
jgi:hypothetical protein